MIRGELDPVATIETATQMIGARNAPEQMVNGVLNIITLIEVPTAEVLKRYDLLDKIARNPNLQGTVQPSAVSLGIRGVLEAMVNPASKLTIEQNLLALYKDGIEKAARGDQNRRRFGGSNSLGVTQFARLEAATLMEWFGNPRTAGGRDIASARAVRTALAGSVGLSFLDRVQMRSTLGLQSVRNRS